MSITLYDLGTADPDLRFSPFCWRAKMSLAHKGLSWQEVACLFTEKDRLPQPNSATVPIIVDDGSVVSDSWKIAEYLDRKYPDNPLFDGPQAKSVTRLVRFWVERSLHPFVFRMGLADFMSALDERDKAYFRQSREKRFGKTIEDMSSDPEQGREGFAAALEPLRAMLGEQDYIAGSRPAFADYMVFGVLQWVRCGSPFPALKQDDPVFHYRERLLDLFDGLGRKARHREMLP